MSTAADWFATDLEFRQLCGDAVSLAHAEASQEFAAEMVKKAKQHGLKTYLSEKQLNWLCQIADWERPMRLSESPGSRGPNRPGALGAPSDGNGVSASSDRMVTRNHEVAK